MALPPTGSGPNDLRARAGLPPARRPTGTGPGPAKASPAGAVEPALPQTTAAVPARGRRLRTAISEVDIERQIRRLLGLLASGDVDRKAPPGSYLNLLV